MYQRLADALGLSLVTALVLCWAAAGVVLVAGLLVLLLGGALALGVVLFAAGAIGSVSVGVGLLRARADVPAKDTPAKDAPVRDAPTRAPKRPGRR